MRFEYAILGLVAIFSFVLLVSAVYPDSISANAITTPVVSPGKAIAVQPVVETRESPDIINRMILSDIANLKEDVSELNEKLGEAETCCQESRQDISIFGQEINDFNSRLNQLEQRVTQQERAGGQAQSAEGMFGQCQAFGTGAYSDNCNAACISLGKACAFAIQETAQYPSNIHTYRFASCSETNYHDASTNVRYSCMCC